NCNLSVMQTARK
ncbi:putative periplasmic repressor CpxP, partial [Vibrio parahaemolyticus EKP-028]